MANIMRVGGGGGEKLTITVSVETGSAVTATKATKTVSGTAAAGVCVLSVPEAGAWVVTATKGSNFATSTVTVVTAFAVTLAYKPTASLTAKSGVTYTSGIAGITPANLSLYGEAISNNAAITNATSIVYIDYGENHYKISVGDAITLTVSGAAYEFVVIGFNHDDLTTATVYGAATATGKAGMTLQMRNCLFQEYQLDPSDGNANGWDQCALHATLQSTIKGSMDDVWEAVLKTVNKKTSAGNLNSSIVISGDTLFLLSDIETTGNTTFSFSGEGNQYAWYKAGNTTLKTGASSNAVWWYLRSPSKQSTTSYCGFNQTGAFAYIIPNAYGGHGIAFGFCV